MMRRFSIPLLTMAGLGTAAWLFAISPGASEESSSETYRQLNLFGEVFERVRADYVESVADSKLIESAINGMLTSLDPHSSYLNSKAFQDMQVQTKGEFGGLGIEVTMDNGLVKVVSPIDDTPAFQAGIKAGDMIVHLDGEPVQGMTLTEAVERMRGKVGTSIVLTILREGMDPFDVTLTRAVIHINSVRSRAEKDVGYIRITTFNEQTDEGLKKAVADLKREIGSGLRGFVLDIRNNPGGLLDQAIAVSDDFLEQGEIVSTRGRQADDIQRFNARSGDLASGLPIVVLVNGGSASAAEIVAGALQDHRRAVIMGTRSFGKGSVQTVIPMGNQGAIRLTTARYYTPSGRSIQATGIEPDITVAEARIETLESADRRREADLRGALANGNELEKKKDEAGKNGDAAKDKPDATKDKPDAAKDKPDANKKPEPAKPGQPLSAQEDYQLTRALDLLRGVSLFRERAAN